MNRLQKKRLLIIFCLTLGVSIATLLILYALKQNINLYYTPSQLTASDLPPHRVIRLGGMVEKNSVKFAAQGVAVSFVLTDFKGEITVYFNGVLPALFREGQGIVAQGELNSHGVFIADQVLAKHDEKYMPPTINNLNPM